MKTVEIFDEDNLITQEDDFATTDITFDFENKKLFARTSIKDDCFYNKQVLEYKISVNPIEIQMRTLESSHEPPLEYSIKDGVILESELKKNKFFSKDQLENLKREVEWSKFPLLGNYEVNIYILSKHPEIVSKEEYRKFLRQSVERIKSGLLKIEELLEKNTKGLEIKSNDNGKYIWYKEKETDEKESEEYYKLPEDKKDSSNYGKKLDYARKFNESIFEESSSNFIGIQEYEFRNSDEILKYIDNLLNKKEVIIIKKSEEYTQQQNNTNKNVGTIIYLLTIFFIILKLTDSVDWGWFAVISPVLIWQGLGFINGFFNRLAK